MTCLGAGSWRCEDGGYSSASDASDSDGGSVGSSPSSTSLIRVRLTALSCLQVTKHEYTCGPHANSYPRSCCFSRYICVKVDTGIG
jgi:hypothetical protein